MFMGHCFSLANPYRVSPEAFVPALTSFFFTSFGVVRPLRLDLTGRSAYINYKEVIIMEYSLTCPSPCNYEIKVEANSDDEAVGKIMQAGAAHINEAHSDMKISEEQMRSMVRSNMKKGSCACMAKKNP
jgi:predicted small metal-binding protein